MYAPPGWTRSWICEIRDWVLREGPWLKDGWWEFSEIFCILPSPMEYQKVTGRTNSQCWDSALSVMILFGHQYQILCGKIILFRKASNLPPKNRASNHVRALAFLELPSCSLDFNDTSDFLSVSCCRDFSLCTLLISNVWILLSSLVWYILLVYFSALYYRK